MTIREIVSRLREIVDEEAAIVGEACALQTRLRERNPESATHVTNLLTYLIPEINTERGRLRALIRKLEGRDGNTVCDESWDSVVSLPAERLSGYRASLAHAKQNQYE